eukprot:CAMPEP_0176340216 /NCGR_PEP_ID=MMETSP0126-20121128/1393_1 /TAXON_ID=141414 ORGANISM="Strombidinopsis acuminatum, Strain SPMC142" /NCGR_SAMPLE_ID=MMETSP0126 /ASSEMBLY_ACC=CAM_ASM_000229 /LENGTH=92 /DNA_ID=CAMNT_0017684285 /DNA_START=40 /DNA_END=318 /DNA_ORIENTATION=-
MVVPPNTDAAKMENKYFFGVVKKMRITRNYEDNTYSKKMIVRKSKQEIGGFLSIGASECDVKATMPKSNFYCGEKVAFDLEVDNTKCKKKVT